jgi:hypothetical protein
MKWNKMGQIFVPDGKLSWMRTHAAVPIAEKIEGDNFRVYFSARDMQNRATCGWVKVNLCHPKDILDISHEPSLSPGTLGDFDDSGAMASWITNEHGARYLYYQGWNLAVTVPFRNAIGIAREEVGRPFVFKRLFPGPIIDRLPMEPHFTGTPCVIKIAEKWKMWYLSCVGWPIIQGKPRHMYHIKYAESVDGIKWTRDGVVAIDFNDENEYAISRPSVIHDLNCWRMWYSFRGDRYRIGYAESIDGVQWTRKDNLVGIDVSQNGWDSDMIEYPFVFDHRGNRYMLYNGNDYGRTGFGLAVLE